LGTLSLTDPANGTTADASLIADNNAAIKTVVNGGIEDSNIADDAAIDASKIAVSYTTYVPTWTASGTAPAIGNATVVARYAQLGKMVHAYGSIAFGSTSTFGSGLYAFALPATEPGTQLLSGSGVIVHAATSAAASVFPIIASSTTMNFQFPSMYLGTVSTINPTGPWTWASSDAIYWNIMYEAA
jgi:hypothetical protein